MYLLKTVKTYFWKIGQHPFLMLSDRSGIFFRKQDSFTIINQMKIHGILCAERIAAGNRIGNFTVAFYGFHAKNSPGCLHKQRNGTVDHRYQPWYNNVFAA